MPVQSDLLAHRGRQVGGPADHVQPHVVRAQLLSLGAKRLAQDRHERAHLARGALPVLDRERVEREHVHAERGAAAHRLAHRFAAGAMAHEPRHPAGLRPAAVAVHDDRDVPRDVPARDQFLGTGWRSRGQGISGRRGDGDRGRARSASWRLGTRRACIVHEPAVHG